MSRIEVTGINPETNESVSVFYGAENDPFFGDGYFFQVFDKNDTCIVNEGFVKPISSNELYKLKKKWKVR